MTRIYNIGCHQVSRILTFTYMLCLVVPMVGSPAAPSMQHWPAHHLQDATFKLSRHSGKRAAGALLQHEVAPQIRAEASQHLRIC